MHASAVNLLTRAGCLAQAALAMLALALAACAASSRQAAPTAAPIVIATAAPTASAAANQPAPTPVPPPTPAGPPTMQPPVSVYVTNTDGQRLTLRQTPGGTSMGALPDGSALTTTGGTVAEFYDYDDYGAVTFLTSAGLATGATSSAVTVRRNARREQVFRIRSASTRGWSETTSTRSGKL